MSYEQKIRHAKLYPQHIDAIITSSHFATEDKFKELARNSLKIELDEDEEVFVNPYKNKWRKRKEVMMAEKNKVLNLDESKESE